MKHMKINSDYTEIYKKLNEQSLQDISGDVIRERNGLGQGVWLKLKNKTYLNKSDKYPLIRSHISDLCSLILID